MKFLSSHDCHYSTYLSCAVRVSYSICSVPPLIHNKYSDNSGSMKQGNRIQALNQTLQNIADWATRIEKDGIFLRFLNGNQDQNGLFDGLTDPNKIDDLIGTVKIRGNTRLGSVLSDKVVTPLARKAARRKRTREQIKPRIVMIITDGKVCEPDSFMPSLKII